MLYITKDENEYINVIETINGWNESIRNIVLYDLKNKRHKINNDPWYPMTQSDIDWVNKYYVPKLEGNKQ